MHLEIWNRFLMARDEVFKTKEEKLMEAIETVQELIRENNLALTFYAELEKIYYKNTSEEKKIIANTDEEKKCRKQ